MPITITDIKTDPNPLKAGQKVKVTCKIEATEGIQSVQVYDPRDWVLKMYDDGSHGDEVAEDGVYTLVETVPYDAPPGTYYSTIIVRDNNDGIERKTVDLQIA